MGEIGLNSIQDLFVESENHLSNKILKYNSAIKEALSLNDMNIQEKSMVASSLHHGFINCLFAERNILEELESKKDIIEEALLAKFGKENVPRYECKEMLSKNDDIKKLYLAIANQKKTILYLENVCEIVKNYSFNIKNATELLKLSK